MNMRLYDGSVRCMNCMDASSYESETHDECSYCGYYECGWATPELCHATPNGASGGCQDHELGGGVHMVCCDTRYATVAETMDHTCPLPPLDVSPRVGEDSYINEYGDIITVHYRHIHGETYVFHRVDWFEKDFITVRSGSKGKGRGHSWDFHRKTGELFRVRPHPLFLS